MCWHWWISLPDWLLRLLCGEIHRPLEASAGASASFVIGSIALGGAAAAALTASLSKGVNANATVLGRAMGIQLAVGVVAALAFGYLQAWIPCAMGLVAAGQAAWTRAKHAPLVETDPMARKTATAAALATGLVGAVVFLLVL